jgi:hypothetical protein
MGSKKKQNFLTGGVTIKMFFKEKPNNLELIYVIG